METIDAETFIELGANVTCAWPMCIIPIDGIFNSHRTTIIDSFTCKHADYFINFELSRKVRLGSARFGSYLRLCLTCGFDNIAVK